MLVSNCVPLLELKVCTTMTGLPLWQILTKFVFIWKTSILKVRNIYKVYILCCFLLGLFRCLGLKNSCLFLFACFFFWFLGGLEFCLFEISSHYISQANLGVILLPQCPDCWDSRFCFNAFLNIPLICSRLHEDLNLACIHSYKIEFRNVKLILFS